MFFNIKFIVKIIFIIMICNVLNCYDNLYKLVIEMYCYISYKYIYNIIVYLKLNVLKIGIFNLLYYVNVKLY